MGCANSKKDDGSSRGDNKSAEATSSPLPDKVDQSAKLLTDYTLGDILGQGAYGIVYACTKVGETDFKYAVKMVDKVETPMTEIKKEVKMLETLTHENVVRIHQAYYEKFFVCIVMDRYHGGDLIEGMQLHWKTKGKIRAQHTVHLAKQMLMSIAHLHKHLVVHRDVKGDNYLTDRKDIVDPKCRVIMSDFGTALTIPADKRLNQSCGTRVYWSPEFYAMNYSFLVDEWALGVVMFGLLDGRFPFKGEKDVKGKEVKLPGSVPSLCTDFVLNLLNKVEKQRMSAEEGLNHKFITSLVTDGDKGQTANNGEDSPDIMKEMGANAGQDQRRKELVDRLERAKQKKEEKKKGEKSGNAAIAYQQRFEVVDRVTNRVVRYEWWSPEKVQENSVINLEDASTNALDTHVNTSDVVRKTLEEHEISVKKWGKGQAKTFDEFAAEVQNGEAVLMLDATKHRRLVRVVDVVCVRLIFKLPTGHQYLIEFSETYADGRKRELQRLPASKKEPHENTRKCAERIISEIMGLKKGDVKINFSSKETFEEETESVSFPGVDTVYRKEIVEGVLSQSSGTFQSGDKKYSHTHKENDQHVITKEFGWVTEDYCKDNSIMLNAPAEDEQISGLVQAPVGFTEEELKKYLEVNSINVEALLEKNPRSLQEFSTELTKGEATLMTRPDGTVVRVVDVALLYLTFPETGAVLVESEERLDGQVNKLQRLPGTKRRPDENQFLTAQRFLKKNLKMDENSVTLNNTDVKVLEEEKESPNYPGVRTLYRKRIIKADLQPLHA